MKATRLREAARRVLDEGALGVFQAARLKFSAGPEAHLWWSLDDVCAGADCNLAYLPPDLRAMLLLMAAAVAESDEELP